MKKWRRFWHKFSEVLLTIAGAPNYEQYLAYFKKHYPEQTPLSEKEFYRKMNDEKYEGNTIRKCC